MQPRILSGLLCFCKTRIFSKGILAIIIIPPWFQAWIYWKKFVIWRHHLQPSIFSMIVSLFHGSTWSNPHVEETVFISEYFLQPPILVTFCHSLYSSLSLFVTCCTIRCHSLSFLVIRCHSLYHSLSLVVIRCHSLSLDVTLVCLFTTKNDHVQCHS